MDEWVEKIQDIHTHTAKCYLAKGNEVVVYSNSDGTGEYEETGAACPQVSVGALKWL